MGFEKPSFKKTPSDKKEELSQTTKNGYVLEKGIWRKKTGEELVESAGEDIGKEEEKEIQKSDRKREELDQEYEKLEKKEYKTSEDLERMKKIEEEHQKLSAQIKELERKEKPGEQKEVTEKKQEESIEKEPKEKDKKKEDEGKIKEEKEEKVLKIEQEIIENYHEELKKIKAMPENTEELKKSKAEKCFELIDSWLDQGYQDNYIGIQKTLSEIERIKPRTWFYGLKKNQTLNKVALSMSKNYKEWNLEDRKKIKIIKKIIDKQEEGFWENKDKTLTKVAEILASQEIPYKDFNLIIQEIKDPDMKTKATTKIISIEKKSRNQKKHLLEKIKKEAVEEEEEEKVGLKKWEKIASSLNIDKLSPEIVSQLFSKASELLSDPEVQKQFKGLKKAIEKVIQEKEKAPDAVTKAAEFIKKEGAKGAEKKDSKLKTIFGVLGSGILLLLTLFILLLPLKGVDYFVDLSGGKKK